jgi:hypothetical protein
MKLFNISTYKSIGLICIGLSGILCSGQAAAKTVQQVYVDIFGLKTVSSEVNRKHLDKNTESLSKFSFEESYSAKSSPDTAAAMLAETPKSDENSLTMIAHKAEALRRDPFFHPEPFYYRPGQSHCDVRNTSTNWYCQQNV